MTCRLRRSGVALFAMALVAGCSGACARTNQSSGSVVLVRTPNGGLQPQTAVDSDGTLHLIYFSGPAEAGDLYYVRQPGGQPFSAPIRVNSQPGSAIAIGTVRGAHLAVGRAGRIHVAWNGSGAAQPRGGGGAPMLYARLNDARTAFEPQRNVIVGDGAIDGGGTVAADAAGTVYVAWHAAVAGQRDDADRRVFLVRSIDDGRTFERERSIGAPGAGACSCCGMSSAIDRSSNLHLFYRSARGNVDREMTLLGSIDRGVTFAAVPVHHWSIDSCPLTTSALVAVDEGVIAAWETENRIYFEAFSPGPGRTGSPMAPPGRGVRRHPVVARNAAGETLLAWTAGMAWGKGGEVAWQLYDPAGLPTSAAGHVGGVPSWGSLSVSLRADGRFSLWY